MDENPDEQAEPFHEYPKWVTPPPNGPAVIVHSHAEEERLLAQAPKPTAESTPTTHSHDEPPMTPTHQATADRKQDRHR
jgi:hypothetical protein